MPTDLCLAHLVRRDWLTDGPLNKLIDLYIEALQNRRYARNTLSAYLRCLAHFSYWMRGEGLSAAGIDRALIGKRPATPSPRGSPNSVFMSTPNGVDTYPLQFLLNSASAYACPAVGQ